MSSSTPTNPSRRHALQCMAFGGLGTLFTLSGGVLTPFDLALAQTGDVLPANAGRPLFVQISDTHIGFNKDANPDVSATLKQTIDLVNGMPAMPALAIHTGDITHLSKPEEFDHASQLLAALRVPELHTVPGEHDVTDGSGAEYFGRFGKASDNRGYYSFDHAGVHFIGLVNVVDLKAGGLGNLGHDQLEWLEADLKGRSTSTPIVVFAHIPLWTVFQDWGWGTEDGAQALSYLKRFGSVTVLNGHIHQIMQKVEGNVTFHTARSTAFPQPAPGSAPSPGPMKVADDKLRTVLGTSDITFKRGEQRLAIVDKTLS